MSQALVTFINTLILSAMAIGIPTILIAFIALFNVRIKKNKQIYLYAFTAGLLLILGTVGFLGEAISHSKDYFNNIPSLYHNNDHKVLSVFQTLQIIGVVGGGAVFGLLVCIVSRYIFVMIGNRTNKDLHEQHHEHNHAEFLFNASDVDNKKIKWMPVLLLSGHRFIDGIVLGFMANTTTAIIAGFDNWGMIIVFIIHLIPTSIVIYFIQLDIHNNKRFKSLFYSFLLLLLMVPFALIGGFLINAISNIWWLLPLLYSISGTMMTFGGIMEIIPEFIHSSNASLRQWILVTLSLGSAIVLSVILLIIHSH